MGDLTLGFPSRLSLGFSGFAVTLGFAAGFRKLVHLIYGVLKTRKPFDVNWAKAALETVALVAQPPKNSVLALDFQDGI